MKKGIICLQYSGYEFDNMTKLAENLKVLIKTSLQKKF